MAALGGFEATVDAGPFGVSRTLTVLVLAYAILRHQLLGIDVEVKGGIKQSTVAAAFIGVFFVVSESTATFFAGSVGPYLGIAAAGMLVFALITLQRAAERVANAAMPSVKALAQPTRSERARLYQEQVRFAWADGALSREVRLILDHLRDQLALGREEASRLEGEALGHASPRAQRR